jgi:hypothetical protein
MGTCIVDVTKVFLMFGADAFKEVQAGLRIHIPVPKGIMQTFIDTVAPCGVNVR